MKKSFPLRTKWLKILKKKNITEEDIINFNKDIVSFKETNPMWNITHY